MKIGFVLPSCSYNIVISKEELAGLLEKGHALIHVGRTSCNTARIIVDESGDFKYIDKKVVPNNLQIHLDEPVVDCEKGYWPVQFLNIHIESED